VDHAADGERADFLAQTEGRTTAMVLDLGLQRSTPPHCCGNWREAGLARRCWCLRLAAVGTTKWGDRRRADDYVSKPFRIEEVLARLRALIRRTSGHLTLELRAAAWRWIRRQSRVTLDGEPVKLTGHEFRVLSYLMHPLRARCLSSGAH